MREIKYLACGGGGVRICVFPGAFAQLEKEPKFSFKKLEAVSGTSAGAIAALMVSMEFSAVEMKKKLFALKFKKLKDHGLIAKWQNFRQKMGWYKGKYLADNLKSIISEKIKKHFDEYKSGYQSKHFTLFKMTIPESLLKVYNKRFEPEKVTFADLQTLGCKDLYIVSTLFYLAENSKGELVGRSKKMVFSTHKTPNTSVLTALKASVAAPPYFQMIWIKKIQKGMYVEVEDKEAHAHADGGFSDQLPTACFDQKDPNDPTNIIPNPYTLGLGITELNELTDQKSKKIPLSKGNLRGYFEGMIYGLLANSNKPKYTDPRVIMIDSLGVKSFDFEISHATQEQLYQSGVEGVRQFFQNSRKNDEIADEADEALFETPQLTR